MGANKDRQDESGSFPHGSPDRVDETGLRDVPPEVLRDLVDIQERDRRLVAYEIHDGLTQQLTGTLYSFQIFEQLRERSPEEAEKAFARGMGLLQESLAESRRLINGLRPPILDDHGIVDALDYLVSEIGKSGDLTIEFDADFPQVRLTAELENTLFRIAQESLSNVQKHSGSLRAAVALRRQEGRVRLTVRDWGSGFDPQEVGPDRFGLRSIRDRAALVGGRAEIRSTPGQGTEVTAEVPYRERDASPDA